MVSVGVLVLVGCAGARTVRQNFAGDFNCADSVAVEEIAQNRFRASGCGTSAVYQCVNYGPYGASTLCSIEMAETSPPDDPASVAPSPARRTSSTKALSKTKDGRSAVRVEVRLDDSTLVKLVAAPGGKSEKVLFRLLQRDTSVFGQARNTDSQNCKLGWLVNGERIEGPTTKVSRDGSIASYRVYLSPALVRELAVASKLSLRVCDQKWSLTPEQVGEIRRFFDLYEEELAWQDKPRKGGTGGLVAPSGGWAAWGNLDPSSMKAAVTGDAVDATELFKQLKRSVYQLEALSLGGMSQGSAVAVTKSELLTNCHVVEGAKKVVVKREKKEWVATVSRSDPASDRCVLSLGDPILEPVPGVRTWESLQVGEALYALGSPAGLELSLSNGILSGIRDEKDLRFVQTTTPISPGSSGGGLFDARGNLVGVTTLVVVGRQRLNQALNLAIPAERFFEP